MENVTQQLPVVNDHGDLFLENSRTRNAIYGAIGGLVTAGSLALESDLSNRDILVNMAAGAVAGGAVASLIKGVPSFGGLGTAYAVSVGVGSALILTRPLILGLNKVVDVFNTDEVNDEAFPEVEDLPTV